MRDIALAAIAALAPTLASVAALIKVTRIGKTADQVNRAVNHQPSDAPTLVERVIAIHDDIDQLRQATNKLSTEVRSVKTAQNRHLAWHQAKTEEAQ
jgi:hypothetical protein